jgi:uncharacterized protein (TIGR02147 family)
LTPLAGSAKTAFMLQKYLLQEFERRSQSNPNYSLRAFARDLEIHSGTLSSILKQRRTVGAKVLSHLLKKLPLTAMEKKKILSELIASPSVSSENFPVIDEESLSIIKDWEHYAIMAYLQLRKAKKTPLDIAKALGLPQAKVLRALANLEKTELLKREGDQYKVTYKNLATSNGVPNTALREAHAQYIDKAKNALNDFSPQERDITGRTMAIATKNLPRAKELIQQFRSDLSELLANGEVDDVFRLNIQLFPLTQKKNAEV